MPILLAGTIEFVHIEQVSALNKFHCSKPYWATSQQVIAKTPAKWSAYQIPSVIVVFVILVFKV
jgi:hypothetical protein